ncbi:MAG: hypothetical protein IKN27_08920 [Selenomonadaceae bacterium]|nr:hypothetical protein [Selenomonadaceae bacterium]
MTGGSVGLKNFSGLKCSTPNVAAKTSEMLPSRASIGFIGTLLRIKFGLYVA